MSWGDEFSLLRSEALDLEALREIAQLGPAADQEQALANYFQEMIWSSRYFDIELFGSPDWTDEERSAEERRLYEMDLARINRQYEELNTFFEDLWHGRRFVRGKEAETVLRAAIETSARVSADLEERTAWAFREVAGNQGYVMFVDKDDEVVLYRPPSWPVDGLRNMSVLYGRLPLLLEAMPPSLWNAQVVRVLSSQPAQTIDRALRGRDWEFPAGLSPRFVDASNGHVVEYAGPDGPSGEQQRVVHRLNARSSDVWQLVASRTLELWRRDGERPPGVWLDVRELAEALGYRRHPKGGQRPQALLEVAHALETLNYLKLTIPHGARYYPLKEGKSYRPSAHLEHAKHFHVLTVSARDEVRNLLGHHLPLLWQVQLGGWVELYPRMFATLFRPLLTLPGKRGVNAWTKALGVELAYQYRQDRGGSRTKKLGVRTLLGRATLLEEATAMKNRGRAREYFERALDELRGLRFCATWEYEGRSIDRVDQHRGPGQSWFEPWLEAQVSIRMPDRIAQALAGSNGKHRRSRAGTPP